MQYNTPWTRLCGIPWYTLRIQDHLRCELESRASWNSSEEEIVFFRVWGKVARKYAISIRHLYLRDFVIPRYRTGKQKMWKRTATEQEKSLRASESENPAILFKRRLIIWKRDEEFSSLCNAKHLGTFRSFDRSDNFPIFQCVLYRSSIFRTGNRFFFFFFLRRLRTFE